MSAPNPSFRAVDEQMPLEAERPAQPFDRRRRIAIAQNRMIAQFGIPNASSPL